MVRCLGRARGLVSSLKRPYRLWGAPTLVFDGYQGLKWPEREPAIYNSKVKKSNCTSIPHTPSWGAQGLLPYCTASLLNRLFGAGNFGKIWSICGQHGIQYTE